MTLAEIERRARAAAVRRGIDPDSPEGDAFRHTFASAMMALIYGEAVAGRLGDAKEWRDGVRNTIPAHLKDYFNNARGREIARRIPVGLTTDEREERIADIIAEEIGRAHEGEQQSVLVIEETDPRIRPDVFPRSNRVRLA